MIYAYLFLKRKLNSVESTKRKVKTTGTQTIYSHHMGEESFRPLSHSPSTYRNTHMILNT